MPPVNSQLVALGTPLPAFDLPDLDGKPVTSGDLAGPALLVAFLSNHCPFVRHVERRLAEVTTELAGRGLSVVAIASNDTGIQPDDDVDGLRGQVERVGFTFPYLVDAAQRTARDFHAACTPDFFLYDADRRLAYRGAFDRARPGNDVPVTGDRRPAGGGGRPGAGRPRRARAPHSEPGVRHQVVARQRAGRRRPLNRAAAGAPDDLAHLIRRQGRPGRSGLCAPTGPAGGRATRCRPARGSVRRATTSGWRHRCSPTTGACPRCRCCGPVRRRSGSR
ncbi:peroxiredoxin [Micromonospora sp. M71_S20]|uniref:thioredoxin family protein n=1 Tax=Micromonospora sp. M71_S20 TaxID=592872 RepID=UPI000F211A29|nr:thioredoxin family protein [Micromonospora sp. M71_S20]RLK22547.1 peroxiredoxin [Micromonospora sp. M71_S20]